MYLATPVRLWLFDQMDKVRGSQFPQDLQRLRASIDGREYILIFDNSSKFYCQPMQVSMIPRINCARQQLRM